MYKTEGSITSQYGDGTREDFLLTYDENEKQQNEINKKNAQLVLKPKFVPVDCIGLRGLGLNLIDKNVYGFIDFFLCYNESFYCTNEQIAELFEVSGATISSSVSKLEKLGLIKIHYKIKAGGGKIRFISTTSKNLKSDFKKFDGIDNKIIENKKILDLLPNGNKCENSQNQNIGCTDTIETQETEKEASGQNQENIQEYKTIEGKDIAERLKKGVTFEDVNYAFPSMKNFDSDKAQKKFKTLIDSGMSIDKMFLNAFLEKLMLRVSGVDYRYVMRFDNWLNNYHEIDEEMEDAKIQEILSKFWSTKETHHYKESVYLVLEDVLGKERVRPILKNVTKIKIIIDGKQFN